MLKICEKPWWDMFMRAWLCLTLCSPMDYSPPGFSAPGFSSNNIRVGCYFLLQGIFPTKVLKQSLWCLLHWQVDSLPLVLPWKPKQSGRIYKILILMTLIRTQANLIWGVPGGSDGKNPPAMQETRVWSLVWEDPLEKGMTVHSSILAWRIRQRSLVGHSPWGHKSNTTEQLTFAFFSYRILLCFTDTELFLLLVVLFSNQLKVSGNPPFYQV